MTTREHPFFEEFRPKELKGVTGTWEPTGKEAVAFELTTFITCEGGECSTTVPAMGDFGKPKRTGFAGSMWLLTPDPNTIAHWGASESRPGMYEVNAIFRCDKDRT